MDLNENMVTLTANTNVMTLLKLETTEPFKPQSVLNNYTYILSKHNPLEQSGKNNDFLQIVLKN